MRRIAIWLSLSVVAAGALLACGAFSGSDVNTPSASDSAPGDGAGQVDPMADGASSGEGGSKDAGPGANMDGGCVNGKRTLFSLPSCSSPPAITSDGGTASANNNKPDSATGPSCEFDVKTSAGFVTFSKPFDVDIVGPSTLEFAVLAQPLPDVASFGCSVRTQVGNDFTEASLRVVNKTQQVAYHWVSAGGSNMVSAGALPVASAEDVTWNTVALVIDPVGASPWPVSVSGANGNGTASYGPFPAPKGSGTVSITCGIGIAQGPAQVFVDAVTLTTACK